MRPKLIQFVTFSHANMIDLAGPFEVFQMANYFSTSALPPYVLQVIALSTTTTHFQDAQLTSRVLEADTPAPHTLIIPGGPGIERLCSDPKFRSDLVPHINKATRLVAVCTGIFALAAAGRLKGKHVTTHWSSYDALEQGYPEVIVKRGPIFINDGPVWTSAGVTSGIDLCLSIVEKDLGHSAALEVAKHLIMFLKRPGDQNQFSTGLTLQTKSEHFSDLHAWVKANLKGDLSLARLAEHMKMSERTLMRKYKASMGQTPTRMVEALRLEAVRHLLASSDRPLKDIADATGLGCGTNVIRKFTKFFDTTPSEYRARFRSTLQ
ncbi:helix-turn-helix domain-containing protein [Pseudomonas syringae]|nr:helix-turn-helix domain-containing protein [Pseudomonas syringae]MBD8572954.1 helix-turn-helix domain-containing protein [Pseudomonas syringae]